MLRSLFALVTISAASLPAHAQASTQPHAPAGCEDAAARINGSALPRVGAAQWNDWMTLTGCGSRGATIIGGAIKSDLVRGESELTRLDHLAGLLDGWFQPQLVTAYEFVLRAPDASNAMKLRAMWLLSGLYAPSVDVAGPLQGYMSTRCETYERTTTLREASDRLPESAYNEARAAITFAADDRMSPEYVRTTARCWDGVIRDELAHSNVVEDDAPVMLASHATVIVNRPVRVVYDCDNRFVFYNDAGYDLAVRYNGYGTGVLRVTRGGPYVWTTARFGPVRFWMGDTEIFYEAATYRPCYSYGYRMVVGGPIYPWNGWHSGLGVYINVNVPIVRQRVRYVVRPDYYPRRVYTAPGVVRPIIVNPGRRGNDDWNRGQYDGRNDGWNDGRGRGRYDGRDDWRNDGRNDGRSDGRRDDDRNRGRGNDDGNRGRGGDDRGRASSTFITPPPRVAEPRREERSDNGRSDGDKGRRGGAPFGPPAAQPRQEQPQRGPELKVEAPRGRPEMPGPARTAVKKG